MPPQTDATAPLHSYELSVCLGIDIVQISRIEQSLLAFGDRFTRRLFTERERGDADQHTGLASRRYAARFAAKEATLKAFDLAHAGINWRDIEVLVNGQGGCALQLHGKAARLVDALPAENISLSLSDDGDYALAVVTAQRGPTTFTDPNLIRT
jgi:holo-[acyl-carrier protein] synthase